MATDTLVISQPVVPNLWSTDPCQSVAYGLLVCEITSQLQWLFVLFMIQEKNNHSKKIFFQISNDGIKFYKLNKIFSMV